mgnify:FL=1
MLAQRDISCVLCTTGPQGWCMSSGKGSISIDTGTDLSSSWVTFSTINQYQSKLIDSQIVS